MNWSNVGLFGLGAATGYVIGEACRASSDDQPIIMSGGSLHIYASRRKFVRGQDEHHLVHASLSGNPSLRRSVTAVEVIAPAGFGNPPVNQNKLDVEVEYENGKGRSEVVAVTSRARQGLVVTGRNLAEYLQPDGAHIYVPDAQVRSVTVNGQSRTLDGDAYVMVIHFEGSDS